MKAVRPPKCLTIAGFDPSGGAGIIADLKAFRAFDVDSAAVVTSITFQNDREFLGAEHRSAGSVARQIDSVLAVDEIDAVKTGMLPTSQIIGAVASRLGGRNIPLVIDPVISSTTGGTLMSSEATNRLTKDLFPLADLITPNIPEAETLSSLKIANESDAAAAARYIIGLGANAVLIKGGHAAEQMKKGRDLLFTEGGMEVFDCHELMVEMRGTGCMLASAIAANLALGAAISEAVSAAKAFITAQLRRKTL
ncbi:MAG: bifunctional hydroxymethylpyrimidine kinase/phosphomethylpyrimidine kinase [Acidobacteria bacterium]|nr:bifunctional hydroxymethylpyrimidine kinase/phosphomethylpyrimidine kinase [Acidobacteriota bacterium]